MIQYNINTRNQCSKEETPLINARQIHIGDLRADDLEKFFLIKLM